MNADEIVAKLRERRFVEHTLQIAIQAMTESMIEKESDPYFAPARLWGQIAPCGASK